MRALARAWGLPTWDKPASPCLSSRLAPGVDGDARTHRPASRRPRRICTPWAIANAGCRLHEGELARIEVPLAELPRLADPAVREALVRAP